MSPKQDEAPAVAIAAVEPPAVKRGRQAKQLDPAVVEPMRDLVTAGSWAGDGITYPDKAKANKAIADYKRALKDAGVEDELTSRTWEADGGGIHIAIGRKGE